MLARKLNKITEKSEWWLKTKEEEDEESQVSTRPRGQRKKKNLLSSHLTYRTLEIKEKNWCLK